MPPFVAPVLVVVVVVAALSQAACGFWPDHDVGEDDAPAQRIAFAKDFDGYRSWPHVVVGAEPLPDGHAGAPRTVYINAVPTPDATAFPVGTVIVKEGSGKELEGGTGTQTHAMVKRGGSFNAAHGGWEWFEIAVVDGAVVLVWRGAAPPDGESYGCISGDCATALGDCNTCHASARDNDFVLSPALTLGAFDSALLP